MDIEKAIKIIEGKRYTDLGEKVAFKMAIAALRAQPMKLDMSRWEGCQMCAAEYSPEDWAGGDAHDFRVSGDALYYFDVQFGWEGTTIKFCPFCGRPLTEEARAKLERRIGGNDETN